MDNNEYQTVGLYNHNADSYNKVKEAFNNGEDIVAIVHATGTGKSFNALQLAYDNKSKKIVYVVPSKGIIEHIKKIIADNPKLDLERDFPNLEFRTYQSFINLEEEEIESIDCDLLILDEFHHIGAPVWGARINTMIDTHPNIKVFGMTAYTVRDRGTAYERDMANPETDELFSRKVISKYDLCDAMIEGVLPKPVYKSAYVNLIGEEQALEAKVAKLNATSKEYQEYMAILNDIKKRIHEAPSIPKLLKKTIKPDGKYIYFCPPCSEEGANDIETIKKQAIEWFKQFVPEEDIIIYTSTSEMGEEGRKNREAFYDDTDLEENNVDKKLRIMFAINQYNEGIHAPNVDGVIMGRGTTSDIVYYEQLGRALAVRGNTKEKIEELEQYTIQELLVMCEKRDISIKDGTIKEEIIEKLVAPTIIDLANNYEFIKELENNLKDRIREYYEDHDHQKRDIKIRDASFDIEVEDQDLFETLNNISNKLNKTWEEMYEYAKFYYEHHKNLEVPQSFKTNNGYDYDENGQINLGSWIFNQRNNVAPESERGQLLLQIGMRFERKKPLPLTWEEMYEYAKAYYKNHKNLEVPSKFKTNNGYEYDENGQINLGQWISQQRHRVSPESERGQLLLQIGMRFERKNLTWEEMYEYAKIYYEKRKNLEVPRSFKTNNGYEYDENGQINLGKWIAKQRHKVSPESEQGQLLLQIGMRFERKNLTWAETYEYAKIYYEKHKDLEVPQGFKTNNGYEYDENGQINLGQWIFNQRTSIFPESEQGQLLLQIGMRFERKKPIPLTWEEMYEYAKIYYEKHKDLEVPKSFKTNNGYEYDENGQINLGSWIGHQRHRVFPESEQGKLLLQIGMRFERKRLTWEETYEYAKIYYEKHKNLEVPSKFKTNNGYEYDENGQINLGQWIGQQRQKVFPESEQGKLLLQIGMRFERKKPKNNNKDILIMLDERQKNKEEQQDYSNTEENKNM